MVKIEYIKNFKLPNKVRIFEEIFQKYDPHLDIRVTFTRCDMYKRVIK